VLFFFEWAFSASARCALRLGSNPPLGDFFNVFETQRSVSELGYEHRPIQPVIPVVEAIAVMWLTESIPAIKNMKR